MLRKRHFSIHKQVVREEIQPPRRCDRRIEHTHRTRSRIACIHKDLPPNSLLLPVQRFESLLRHHDFAANFKCRRQLHFFQHRRIHAQRNRPDGLHVWCHILARGPIATRNTARQYSILVLQRNTQPIEFVLRDVLDFLLPAAFPHTPVPIAQRLIRKRVVQAHHRSRVPHRRESFARRAAHAHRQRIWRHQFRMRGFQLLQPVHHPVVCRIRNLRLVQHVILVFVVAQLLAKLPNLFFDTSWRSFGHEILGILPSPSFRAKRGPLPLRAFSTRRISLGTRLQNEVHEFGWYYIE